MPEGADAKGSSEVMKEKMEKMGIATTKDNDDESHEYGSTASA